MLKMVRVVGSSPARPTYTVMEVPKHVLKPDVRRALFFTAMLLLTLLCIAYIALVKADIDPAVRLLLISLLFVVITIEIILDYSHHAATEYIFYKHYVMTKKRQLHYNSIADVSFRRNIIDRFFKTHTAVLKASSADEKDVILPHISSASNNNFMIQHIVRASRTLRQAAA
jgi:hypothetical protein